MFLRIWRLRPALGRDGDFRGVYGPGGDWARLFALAPGFLGTVLLRGGDDSPDYLTVDRWESAQAWRDFRERHAIAYEALDRRCDELTSFEEQVGEYDD